MTRTQLVYRGVGYDTGRLDQPSAEAVEHVYRGVHYHEPLRHQPAPVDETIVLHYRGQVYHHRRRETATQMTDS